MSDFFGIGQAIRTAIMIYFQSSRGTGRMTNLVSSVKDGDIILFSNRREADRVYRLCKDRGVDVICKAVSTHGLFHADIATREMGGRIIFDHSWLEKYYFNAIQDAINELDKMADSFNKHPNKQVSLKWQEAQYRKWDI